MAFNEATEHHKNLNVTILFSQIFILVQDKLFVFFKFLFSFKQYYFSSQDRKMHARISKLEIYYCVQMGWLAGSLYIYKFANKSLQATFKAIIILLQTSDSNGLKWPIRRLQNFLKTTIMFFICQNPTIDILHAYNINLVFQAH